MHVFVEQEKNARKYFPFNISKMSIHQQQIQIKYMHRFKNRNVKEICGIRIVADYRIASRCDIFLEPI